MKIGVQGLYQIRNSANWYDVVKYIRHHSQRLTGPLSVDNQNPEQALVSAFPVNRREHLVLGV